MVTPLLLLKQTLLGLLFAVALLVSSSSSSSSSSGNDDNLIDASKLEMFVDEVPDMPRILGYQLIHGVPKPKSLRIGMFQKYWKFHRDLPPTLVFAYGVNKRTATIPGPTIEAIHDVGTFVTWQNNLPSKHILPWDPTIPTAIPRSGTGIPTVVHLHGGIHEPQSDGNANAWFTNGFNETGPTWTQKGYHYTNNQHPGNLWYHDHAMGLTRGNLLAGLLGFYIIRHPLIEVPLGLPQADAYDRPLMIFDRSFRTDGSVYVNSTGNNPTIHPHWRPEYFGDVIIVNGKAWPRMTVQRRKYRFRVINTSHARFFKFFFTNGLRFTHVASDSAYMEEPVTTKEFLLGPSEITDIIVDFSQSNDDTVILVNNAPSPYPSGNPVKESTSKVMKFFIQPHREADPSRVPEKLIKYAHADLSGVTQTRYITMYEYTSDTGEPTHLFLNAKPYEAPATETPKVGSTEVWYVINLTNDNHPLHIHLGLFRVLDQTELVKPENFKACMDKQNDAEKCHVDKYARGKKVEVPAYQSGWKNVYNMMPGFVTKIAVRFGYIHTNASYAFDATAEPGYIYHCHILDHEDNVMMRPLKLLK